MYYTTLNRCLWPQTHKISVNIRTINEEIRGVLLRHRTPPPSNLLGGATAPH